MNPHLRSFVLIFCMVALFNVYISLVEGVQERGELEVNYIDVHGTENFSRVISLDPCHVEIFGANGTKGETVLIRGRLVDDDQIGMSGKTVELYWKKTKFAPLGSSIATPTTDENGNFSYSDFIVPKTQAVGDAYMVGIFQGDETYEHSESGDVLFSITAYVTVLIDPSIPDGEEYNSTDLITVTGEVIEMFEDERTSPPRYVKGVEVSAFFIWEHGRHILYHSKTDDFGQYSMTKSIPDVIAPRDYRLEMAMDETEKYLTKPEYFDHRAIVIVDDSFKDESPPVPIITADETAIPCGNSINFSSRDSTENVEITEYLWEFAYHGELMTFEKEEFCFKFSLPGEYEIKLILEDEEGNVGTDTLKIIVYDDKPPTAMGRVPESAYQGEEVELDATLSRDNAGVVNYTWSFDYNGSSITLYDIESYFEFDIPGEYNITLRVMDHSDNEDAYCFNIEIKDNVLPIPRAIVPKSVEQGEEALLDASLTKDNTGIANYTWSFVHNGTTVLLYEVKSVFIFEIYGDYEILLTVTDLWGNEAEKTYSMRVRDAIEPSALISGKFENIKLRQRVELDGTGSVDNDDIVNSTWTIDGPTGVVMRYGDVAYYNFKEEGTYKIILTVRDKDNNHHSTERSVTVRSDKELAGTDDSSVFSVGAILIILVIFFMIAIPVIVVIIVLKRKKKQKEITESESNIAEERIIPETQKAAPATDNDKAKGPICRGCGFPSTYYPEHGCYWCGKCQSYVYLEKAATRDTTPMQGGQVGHVTPATPITPRSPPARATAETMQASQNAPKADGPGQAPVPQARSEKGIAGTGTSSSGIESPKVETTKKVVRKVVPKKVESPQTGAPETSSLDGWDL